MKKLSTEAATGVVIDDALAHARWGPDGKTLVLADQATKQIKMSFKEGSMEISTRTADVGEASEELPAQYKGEGIDIGFNATYLLDCLGTIESDEVTVAANTSVSASVLWPVDQEENEELLCLVMPVRLPEEVPVA